MDISRVSAASSRRTDTRPGRVPARITAATWVGAFAGWLSRCADRGSGQSIKGRVILRLVPDALSTLLRGKRTAIVTGTNGKTSTAHLLAAAVRNALRSDSADVVHNVEGANLRQGLIAALAAQPSARFAVLEVDERVVADVVRRCLPEIVVMLNLTRDQLDRNHEIKSVAKSWRAALDDAGPNGPMVVANAGDPLVVWAAQTARHVIWVSTSCRWLADASTCPECGARIVHEGTDGVLGAERRWRCTSCAFAQPDGEYIVQHGTIVDYRRQIWDPQLKLPGEFNVSNAGLALAAADLLDVSAQTAFDGMREVSAPAGRYSIAQFGSTRARLILAKNPAGWQESLSLVRTSTVVLAIDSRAADGEDVSWLWDVDFDSVSQCLVIATGVRAQDLVVRLAYSEITARCVPDLESAIAGQSCPFDVIATYTPFQQIRKLGGML